MIQHVRPLTADNVAELPAACRSCTFWELSDAPRGPQTADARRAAESKQLWYRAVELDTGPPGVILRVRDRTLAFATCVPSAHAGRTRRLGTMPSDDALVLTTLWVDPEVRGQGIATVMVHRLVKLAHDAGLRAVEATGTRSDGATCVLPADFLLASGFALHRPHPRYPLHRLDVRQTARWQDVMEHALERVRGALARRDRRTAPSAS